MGSGAGGGMSEGVLTEMRSRLIAGLKRYFHGKRMEGLLSVQVSGYGSSRHGAAVWHSNSM